MDAVNFRSPQWDNEMSSNTYFSNDGPAVTNAQERKNSFGRSKSYSRSRSNTLSSMTSIQSYASGFMNSGNSSRRVSQDTNAKNLSQSSLVDAASSKLKPIFSRGNRPRRSNSKPLLASVHDQQQNAGQLRSLLRKVTSPKERDVVDIKPLISSPFDFQHVSHTAREHVPNPTTRPQESMADIIHMQRTQTPQPELTSIQAEDILFRNFNSITAHIDSDVEDTYDRTGAMSPIPSPQRVSKALPAEPASPPPPAKNEQRHVRHIRSVDSFSRPRMKSPSPSRASIITPPPRTSSRTAFTLNDAFGTMGDFAMAQALSDETMSGDRTSRRSSGVWSPPPVRSPSLKELPTITAEDEDEIAQAVTTPGEIALPVIASPALSVVDVLESVDEEPESYFNRHSRQARASQMLSPLLASPEFLEAMRASNSRPTSGISDTLRPPVSPRLRRSSSSPRLSFTPADGTAVDLDSWEDDIDYLYEHEAEADCDFDWRRPSIENRRAQTEPHALPHLTVPDILTVPDLAPRSTHSTITASSVLTPNDFAHHASNRVSFAPSYVAESDYTDSPISPKRSGLAQVYSETYGAYDNLTENDVVVYDPHHSTASSSRSSRTRHSKRSSYDSSVMTGPSSIYSSFRRSASSSSSLPDLVSSRRSKRPADISVENLIDDVAALTAGPGPIDKETNDASDSDGTPTNAEITMQHKSMSEFSFFEGDEQPPASAPALSAVPSHVVADDYTDCVASPTQYMGPRHLPVSHKHSNSESAAKLLMMGGASPAPEAQATRQRSASSATAGHARSRSRTVRLSLFPTAQEPLPTTRA